MPEREFDYLIVGGGSSGCVLANRLSENQNIRVCLIEAGPSDKSWFLKPAISVMYAMKYKKYTSQYILYKTPLNTITINNNPIAV